MTNKLRTIILVIAGAIVAFFFNVYILENILIPDPCYYHVRTTSLLFDVFYSTPTYNGGHPMPTSLNIVLSLIIGGILGLVIANYLNKRYARVS